MILHALSGGLDSTTALSKLLTSGETVHAHHVVLKSPAQFWIPELRVARKVVAPYFLDKYPKTFQYSESCIDLVESDHCHVQLSVPISLQLACFASGRKNVGAISRGYLEPTKSRAAYTNAPLIKHMYKRLIGYCMPEIYPVLGYTKKQVYAECPVEVRDKLWACLKPVKDDGRFTPCGRCPSCKELMLI